MRPMEESPSPARISPVAVGDADFPGRCEHRLDSGRRCARTTILPNGLCPWHNGLQQRFVASEARYEKYLGRDETLRARFYHFFDDPDICDLRPELALMRTMLSQVLELAGNAGDAHAFLDERITGGITEMSKNVGDLAERVSRMEKKGSGWLSRRQADAFVEYVVGVISDHIDDHVTLVSIQRQLEAASLPALSQAALANDLEPRGHNGNVLEAGEGSGGNGQDRTGGEVLREGDGFDGNGSERGDVQ